MEVANTQISEEFSSGNFPFCYEHFADNVEWKIVGNKSVKGKEAVIAYCDEMMKEMSSSTLQNTGTIGQGDNIAIEGFCDYTDANNNPAQVAYCDVYHFNNGKVETITSYCIDWKK